MYNENFDETFVDDQNDPETKAVLEGKGLDWKLHYKMTKVFDYYIKHFQGMTNEEHCVYLLTDCSQTKHIYKQLFKQKYTKEFISKQVIDLNDYIRMNQESYPELINFVGFVNDADTESNIRHEK